MVSRQTIFIPKPGQEEKKYILIRVSRSGTKYDFFKKYHKKDLAFI